MGHLIEARPRKRLLGWGGVISLGAMRNPIRWKNFRARFLPLYALGLGVLIFFPPGQASLALAFPVIAIGACLRGWGAGHLVKNHTLTVTGPYAHLRHPLYLGTILVATGFSLALGGWIAVAALLVIFPWFVMHYFPRKEESEGARLEELYGEMFRAYRAEVPALWPRRQPWRRDGVNSEVSWTLDRYSENNELGTLLAILAGLVIFAWRAGMIG